MAKVNAGSTEPFGCIDTALQGATTLADGSEAKVMLDLVPSVARKWKKHIPPSPTRREARTKIAWTDASIDHSEDEESFDVAGEAIESTVVRTKAVTPSATSTLAKKKEEGQVRPEVMSLHRRFKSISFSCQRATHLLVRC